VTRRARETWLGRIPGARKHHRWFLPLEGLAFATVNTRGYDLVISSSHAFSKMIRKAPGARHLCYCYSPPRYLWDLFDTYRTHGGLLERAALTAGVRALRWLDRWSVGDIDHFVAISTPVADRIWRWYGRRADIVFPPVGPKPCASPATGGPGDFLLSLGRLVPYKRIDLAIAAAERLGVRLIVAGTGPDRRRLERRAGRCVEFVGEVSEAEAGSLFSACRAFVFCGEEDFGIAPLEANAHGRPVIGFARSGLTETMVPGITAEFFQEQSIDAVAAAIERAWSRGWDARAIQRNAERFSPERFRQGFAEIVKQVCAA